MNLLGEIKKCVSLGTPYVTFGKSGGYVSGVKRVLGFTREEIIFECGKCIVRISGKKMELGKFCAGDAGFIGEIEGVTIS